MDLCFYEMEGRTMESICGCMVVVFIQVIPFYLRIFLLWTSHLQEDCWAALSALARTSWASLSILQVLCRNSHFAAFQVRLIYNILMSGAITHVHEKISYNAPLSPFQV